MYRGDKLIIKWKILLHCEIEFTEFSRGASQYKDVVLPV